MNPMYAAALVVFAVLVWNTISWTMDRFWIGTTFFGAMSALQLFVLYGLWSR